MGNFKLERLANDISRYINNIILTEANDEILKSITITGCNVTKDLSYATIYFTSILDMSPEDLEKEMNEASHFLRGKLSECIEIRHTPDLRFVFDKSIEYGNNIEKIISGLHDK